MITVCPLRPELANLTPGHSIPGCHCLGLNWGCCTLSHGPDCEDLTHSIPAHMCTHRLWSPWVRVHIMVSPGVPRS